MISLIEKVKRLKKKEGKKNDSYVMGDENRDRSSDTLSTNVIYGGYCSVNDLTNVGTAKERLKRYYKAGKPTIADLAL